MKALLIGLLTLATLTAYAFEIEHAYTIVKATRTSIQDSSGTGHLIVCSGNQNTLSMSDKMGNTAEQTVFRSSDECNSFKELIKNASASRPVELVFSNGDLVKMKRINH